MSWFAFSTAYSPTKVTAAQSQPSGKTSPQSARRVGGKRVSSPTPGDGTPKHASSCKRAKLVSPTGATNFEFQGAAAAGLAQVRLIAQVFCCVVSAMLQVKT